MNEFLKIEKKRFVAHAITTMKAVEILAEIMVNEEPRSIADYLVDKAFLVTKNLPENEVEKIISVAGLKPIVTLTAKQIALLIELLEEFSSYHMVVQLEEKDKDELLKALGDMIEGVA